MQSIEQPSPLKKSDRLQTAMVVLYCARQFGSAIWMGCKDMNETAQVRGRRSKARMVCRT